MANEPLRSLAPLAVVHAKPEAVRPNPDGQKKRNDKGRHSHEHEPSAEDKHHPVPNDQGQLTGKLIDTEV
ncbi:MAG: hypothetical protein KJ634_01170 [Gammaproteobacteria bacterium]|nr:hypothetical protein [Gammaproteobacteria bacterium]MBU1414208.1 hypothetical protein [Gammaproteobacteria bacterium]